MTFKMEITSEMLQDENALVEELYAFLNEYVSVRLRYESEPEKEDCVQDSIMYLLKRYHQLEPELKENMNLGKFFYNRAHSFISKYIGKLKARRTADMKYIEKEVYMYELDRLSDDEPDFVDDAILDKIVDSYKLDEENKKLLKEFSNFRLKLLGYNAAESPKRELDKETFELLKTLSFAVIDEYMIESVKDKADV